MQTECSPTLFEFEPVERHKVVAGFDGGIITSDAGGLLLGRLDRGLGLIRRMASCFTDRRDPRLLEHTVETLVGQRVFALALGYEDLNDHDELRHDPLFHVLAGRCHVNHRVTSLWAPTPEIMQRSSLAATVSSRRRGIGGVFGGRPDGVGR